MTQLNIRGQIAGCRNEALLLNTAQPAQPNSNESSFFPTYRCLKHMYLVLVETYYGILPQSYSKCATSQKWGTKLCVRTVTCMTVTVTRRGSNKMENINNSRNNHGWYESLPKLFRKTMIIYTLFVALSLIEFVNGMRAMIWDMRAVMTKHFMGSWYTYILSIFPTVAMKFN